MSTEEVTLLQQLEPELDGLENPALKRCLRLIATEVQRQGVKANNNSALLTRILFLVFGTMASVITGSALLLLQ